MFYNIGARVLTGKVVYNSKTSKRLPFGFEELLKLYKIIAAFYQGLHHQLFKVRNNLFISVSSLFRKKIFRDIDILTYDPFKYLMENPIFIVPICMGNSISILKGIIQAFS